jgi:hypothetical protein
MIVFRNGYVRQEYGSRQPGPTGLPFELIAGEDLAASVQMVPAGTLVGRVYDSFGEPMPGIQVQVLRARFDARSVRTVETVRQVTTNDLGEYRVYWLDPGEYFVSASTDGTIDSSPRGGGLNVAPLEFRSMAALYPGVTDESQAVPVLVSPGEQLSGVDIMLAPIGTVFVSGNLVSNLPPDALMRARVGVTPQGWLELRGRISGGVSFAGMPGLFSMRVEPGAYTLTAEVTVNAVRYGASLPLDVGNRDIDNLTLALEPAFSLPGRVYVEGGATDVASELLDEFDLEDLRVFLDSRQIRDRGTGNAQPIDSDGAFEIEDVLAGDYQVRVMVGTYGLYVKRILLESREIPLADDVEIRRPPVGTLDILLSPNGGRIGGTARDRDGNPSPNVQVVLVPQEFSADRNLLPKTATAGQDGKYSITSIPPGAYRLFAWEYLDSGAYFDPAFVQRFESRGERIRIAENDQLRVDLQVIPESETR